LLLLSSCHVNLQLKSTKALLVTIKPFDLPTVCPTVEEYMFPFNCYKLNGED